MKRIALIGIVLTGALLVPTAGFAQISCSREVSTGEYRD